MLGGFVGVEALDVSFQTAQPDVAKPMRYIVQEHEADGDDDEPDVEDREESWPTHSAAGIGFMDRTRGQDGGDPRVAYSAGLLQIVGGDG